MTNRVFIDTNIFVYAYDRTEAQKHDQALAILDQLASMGSGVISTQVLAEFFVAVTRKLKYPLGLADAYTQLDKMIQGWTVLEMSGLMVLEAGRGSRDYQFQFWDAQLWATARLNQITIVLSEDFNPGAVIEGVKFVNPFAAGFDLNDWL